jgi:hypothetical protein
MYACKGPVIVTRACSCWILQRRVCRGRRRGTLSAAKHPFLSSRAVDPQSWARPARVSSTVYTRGVYSCGSQRGSGVFSSSLNNEETQFLAEGCCCTATQRQLIQNRKLLLLSYFIVGQFLAGKRLII